MSSVLLDLPGPAEVHGGLWYSTPASTRFGRHYHRELELNVLVTGEAHYWFPHRELRVLAPAALWIPPLVEHELIDASPDLSMWVYSFRAPSGHDVLGRPRGAGLAEPSALSSAYHELMHGPRVTGMPAAVLAQVCERSRAGLLRPGLPEFNAILAALFADAWSGRCPPPLAEPAACHPAARRAARMLRDPAMLGSMEELAQSASLSRERLSRVFVQSFGIGLVQYRNHHRVQQFIHDYGHGLESSMLRAALDVGFGSYVQFHRAFKQVVGHPPAQHLELVREGVVDPARTGNSGG
jgi:methylphosphotriester-DNA--protein-cysteine methyltransferase